MENILNWLFIVAIYAMTLSPFLAWVYWMNIEPGVELYRNKRKIRKMFRATFVRK
jgi:hypothetical protein